LANHLGYVNQALNGRDWLVGNAITGADIQMSFVAEAARGLRKDYPQMDAWLKRMQERSAYRRAIERGGPYALLDAGQNIPAK
jgi:glutathione S-transferase